MNQNISLKEIAYVFLKLGSTAFGGPAVNIAMMEDEVIHRRSWISREEFLDLIGVTNFIPGPNSTEMAIHVGYRLAGWRGLFVAGICFILPAVLIVTGFAWAYINYGKLPETEKILSGIKPVIVAIVSQALFRFGQTAIKTRSLLIIAILATIINLLGVSEIVVIFAAGIFNLVIKNFKKFTDKSNSLFLLVFGTNFTNNINFLANSNHLVDFSLSKLFMFFMKVGSILFGSGYVLLAFLKADLVDKFGWLTEAQLLDAIAVGQFTPGPLFTTATFIGYILAGIPGATVATVGIFLPAFFFVAISAPFVHKIRESKNAGIALDGINVASLALMVVVIFILGKTTLTNFLSLGIFISTLILLTRFKVNAIWLIIAGALVAELVSIVA
jgi:chromate transporter